MTRRVDPIRHATMAVVALVVLAVAGVPRTASAVQVERVVSPGGIEAWLIQDHTNPLVVIHMAFAGGSAHDPAGKAGTARLAADLLDEGAGDLDSNAFQDRAFDLAIRFSGDAYDDTTRLSLTALTEYLDPSLDLLQAVLTAPRFDLDAIERVRSQMIVAIERDMEQPGARAARALYETLYPDHPYGQPSNGTVDSVVAITREDLVAFVDRTFTRDGLIIGVSGNITPDRLGVVLDRVFGALPAQSDRPNIPHMPPAATGQVVTVDMDVPQAVARLAQRGLQRDDPDWYAAYVVNYILGGGGFSSRLMQDVRESRGLAYSVWTYLNHMEHSASLIAGVATNGAAIGESIERIRVNWADMAATGPTAEELDHAKTYLTGAFPLRFKSNGHLAAMLASMQLHDLGIDYLDRRNEYIEALTLDDVRRVAARLLDPDSLATVVVGPADALAAAGLTATR